jgi:hypothetical protein
MVDLNGLFLAADASPGTLKGLGCSEWQEMLRAYPAAMQQYCQAVMSLMALDAARFSQGWTKAEQARKICETFREKLFHHWHQHGCLTPRGF